MDNICKLHVAVGATAVVREGPKCLYTHIPISPAVVVQVDGHCFNILACITPIPFKMPVGHV